MCGRFTIRTNPREFVRILEVARGINDDFNPRYNVAPTQSVLCVRDSDQREFFNAKWGVIPSWSKDAKIGSSCPSLYELPEFVGKLHGHGEAAWVLGGKIVSTSDLGYHPECMESV